MDKRASTPVRIFRAPNDPRDGQKKLPALPTKKPTKITIVPAGTPTPPNWSGIP